MTTSDYVNGLRRLADFYEANPTAKLPYEGDSGTMNVFCWTAEDFALIVSAFGNGAKRFEDERLLFLPDIGLNLQVHCDRGQICERRVVGTRHVAEQVVPERVIPAHDEDIVEWDCKPVLAARRPPVTVTVAAELAEGLAAETEAPIDVALL